MKIAIFSPTVSGRGGMESATRNLIAGFQANGDQTRLFLFGGSYDQRWLAGIDHTQYGSPRIPRWQRMLHYATGPLRAILSWQPDVIICSDLTSLRMAHTGRRLSRRKNILLASWIHFPVAKVRMKEYLPTADLHLAISDAIADDLAQFLPDGSKNVFPIYNAIDVDATPLMPRSEKAVFLYAGRLNWDDQKRTNDLLQALARVRGEWKLKIAGAAPKARPDHEPRLKALATELGLDDRVEWLGWQDDPWQAAASATCLVLTSSHEGFPMILLEALAHGLVVISSDCESGPSEIIEPGKNGWLYPVADIDRLTELLQNIVDNQAGLPAREAVRETALRFAAPAIAQRAKNAILAVREQANI